jgi:SGNH domain (fused to AT3 domains)
MRGKTGALATLLASVLLVSGPGSALAADRDKDGLSDGFETKWGVTDPLVRDTDHDGVIDSAEDNDKDGLGNLGEQRFGTDPGRRDSDRDGIPDGREDKDGDGRSNAREQDQRKVPTNLKPSIGSGKNSFPPIRFDCQTKHGKAIPVVCAFGPTGAETRLALIGDSHAMMWSSPFRRVAQAKGWRLLTMTKTACPALLGLYTQRQLEIDGGTSCQKWRRNVIARLKTNPPDLIVITASDRYKLFTANGALHAKSKRPSLWTQALKKTLAALPAASQVLVLGDVPHNFGNPRKCLNHSRDDMSRCVSPKAGPAGRRIEIALKDSARANGAQFRTLYGQICSYDPCPVVQGHILMWRDKSHITNTFAVQLQPSVRAIVEEALQ